MATKNKNSIKVGVTASYVIVFMAAFALSSSMYSNLLPSIIESYSISMTDASLLNITGDAGQIGAMLLAMILMDRLDKNTMLGAMVLLYSAAMFLTGRAPIFVVLLIMRLLIGVSGALTDNLCGTYMSDLYGERRAKYVSVLHTFYAVGSMIGPQVAALFLTRFSGWTDAYTWVGAIFGAVAVAYFATMLIMKKPKPEISNLNSDGEKKKIPFKEILANRNMRWLCVASVLLSSAFYINIWTPTYLQRLDSTIYTVEFCSTLMTITFVGMIVSRILFGALSKKLTAAAYLKWSSLLTAVIIAAMIGFSNKYVWLVGIFLFGVINGAQYTAKFLLACDEFPEFAATVVSLTGIFAALGSMLFSYVIGLFADKGYYTLAMYIPAAMMVLSFILFGAAYGKKKANTILQ